MFRHNQTQHAVKTTDKVLFCNWSTSRFAGEKNRPKAVKEKSVRTLWRGSLLPLGREAVAILQARFVW